MEKIKKFLKKHNMDNLADNKNLPIIIGAVGVIISFLSFFIPAIDLNSNSINTFLLIIKIIISIIGIIIGIFSIRFGVARRKICDDIQAIAPLILGIASVVLSGCMIFASIEMLIFQIMMANA